MLSLLARNAKVAYDGSKCIFHPAPSGRNGMSKGWLYGNGYGLVLSRHHYSILRLFWALGVQSARSVQAVLQLRFKKAAYHIAMAAGRFAGYFNSKRETLNR